MKAYHQDGSCRQTNSENDRTLTQEYELITEDAVGLTNQDDYGKPRGFEDGEESTLGEWEE